MEFYDVEAINSRTKNDKWRIGGKLKHLVYMRNSNRFIYVTMQSLPVNNSKLLAGFVKTEPVFFLSPLIGPEILLFCLDLSFYNHTSDSCF